MATRIYCATEDIAKRKMRGIPSISGMISHVGIDTLAVPHPVDSEQTFFRRLPLLLSRNRNALLGSENGKWGFRKLESLAAHVAPADRYAVRASRRTLPSRWPTNTWSH